MISPKEKHDSRLRENSEVVIIYPVPYIPQKKIPPEPFAELHHDVPPARPGAAQLGMKSTRVNYPK
jgi:hypothetical protein